MRNLLLLFGIISLIFISCSDDDSKRIDPLNELGECVIDCGEYIYDHSSFDEYGVGVWFKESEIVFTDKYSYIDTVRESRIIQRELAYLCSENENITVKWSVNGREPYSVTNKITGNQKVGKFIAISTAYLDISEITENVEIEAVVELPNQKIRRFKTIPNVVVNKDISDAFGYVFGTKREDIDNISHYSPRFSNVHDNGPAEYLEFENGKLLRIHCMRNNGLNEICEQCKIPFPIERMNGYLIKNPQQWNNGKLAFKAFNIYENEILGYGGEKLQPNLTIELLD